MLLYLLISALNKIYILSFIKYMPCKRNFFQGDWHQNLKKSTEKIHIEKFPLFLCIESLHCFPEGALQSLREKGQVLLDQMSTQTSFSYGKDVSIENKENNDHIHSVMEDMQLRKQRFLFFS